MNNKQTIQKQWVEHTSNEWWSMIFRGWTTAFVTNAGWALMLRESE